MAQAGLAQCEVTRIHKSQLGNSRAYVSHETEAAENRVENVEGLRGERFSFRPPTILPERMYLRLAPS
jgi:hypothetical protein